ncbi:peptidoglycan-binding protein [Methylobacterium sp. Leaf456]|uniref:L,D-transpeptidase family protein n=1 Tax=Methylobacterium sp. Leaf456 TaxID=1736382 RepID=UPI0006F9C934|nr:L,D-transpeptidase family protein [Methylobacterium sp. Leaf456]KQT50140.1 peptidoglycan-binding protein [Methylobacterium sp. Leaf456]
MHAETGAGSSVLRTLSVAFAALLALAPAVRGEEAGAPIRKAAVEAPAVPDAPAPAVETPPADAPAQAPTQSSNPAEPPATAAETPAPAAEAPPAPVAPSEPLPAAVFARLNDAAPLLARLSGKEREAMQAFYALGNFKPAWIENGAFNAAATAAIARLRAAAEDGLDPNAYPVPVLGKLSRPDTDAELAEADLKLSAAIALYARDARGGRVNPAAISKLVTPTLDLPTADATLARVASAGEKAGETLQAYNPRQPGYLALKTRLASLRAGHVPDAPSSKSPKRPKVAGGEAEILVNMERWRWLPSELGPDYVFVNVPEFKLRVFRNGTVKDETRVIVGKPESPTPTFSGMMEYAVVNPSWYVPPSILKQMLASGRTAGFEVVRRGGQISLRQPPGERNALGFIKFMFPNQHAVYLHDTPNRSLFSASTRAFSHGCVRVDDPFRFADAVLPDWTEERLKKLIGKGERTLRLPAKLPVHLAYFTAYVDDFGSYRTLNDLYGYDGPMKVALGLAARSDAVARAPAGKAKPAAEARSVPTQNAVRDIHRPAPRPAPREAVRAEPRRNVDMFGEPWPSEPVRRETRSFW